MVTIHPLAPVRVPTKSGRFTIEESYFFLFAFLFGLSGGVDKFHLVEKTNQLTNGGFPFSKASGMGANLKALNWRGEVRGDEVAYMEGQNRRHILGQGRGPPLCRCTIQRQTLSPPKRTMGGVRSGWGQPPRKFLNPTENCCPPRPTLKKILLLHS